MKKLYLSILTALFIVGARAEKPDNTPSLSIWFDTPNNLDGRAIWQPTLWVPLLPNVLH